MGGPGAGDHRRGWRDAEPHRPVALTGGYAIWRRKLDFWLGFVVPGRGRRAARRAGDRARRGRRGRRAGRLDGRPRRRARARRRRAADRLALHARHPAGQRPGRRVRPGPGLRRPHGLPERGHRRPQVPARARRRRAAGGGRRRRPRPLQRREHHGDAPGHQPRARGERLLRRARHRHRHDPPRHRPPARAERGRRGRGDLRRRTTCARSSSCRWCCRAARPISASASSASSSARARSASTGATRTGSPRSGPPRRRRRTTRTPHRSPSTRRWSSRRACRSCARCRTPRRSSRRCTRRATCCTTTRASSSAWSTCTGWSRSCCSAPTRRRRPRSSASSSPGWCSAPRSRARSTTSSRSAAERSGRRVRRRGRRRAPVRPRPRARRNAGARRPDLAARARPPGGYSPAARSGVRSSGSASSISFVKMRSLRL